MRQPLAVNHLPRLGTGTYGVYIYIHSTYRRSLIRRPESSTYLEKYIYMLLVSRPAYVYIYSMRGIDALPLGGLGGTGVNVHNDARCGPAFCSPARERIR